MAPFQSKAQERFLWAKHPDIARRWSKMSESKKKLPEHKKKEK